MSGAVSADMDLMLILPEIVLAGTGLLLLLLEAFLPSERRDRGTLLAGTAVIGAAVSFWSLWRTPVGTEGLGGMIWSDSFGLFFRATLLLILAMVYLTSIEFVDRKRLPAGEFYGLLAFATMGGMLVSVSGDLILFYIGLETLSISSYVLAGLMRGDPRSIEASLKFFLNGVMASALLLFGFSILYGLTGTTNIREVAAGLINAGASSLSVAGLVLVAAGLGFKLAIAPFHLWVPDTYEGAPTPVTAFLSVGSEGTAVAGILRIFFVALQPFKDDWSGLFAVLAALSMTLGNVAALRQKNAKRMLAYSSISQAGYILAGLAAGSDQGFSSAMFYVLAYAFMNVGAFAVLVALANQGEGENVSDLAGLARREPVLAFLMFLFLLSLIGIPPLAGFWAKFFVFRAVLDAGFSWLAVAVALNSVISIGYYWAIVHSMYIAPAAEGMEQRGVGAGIPMQIGMALATAGVLVLGLWPDTFLSWVTTAATIARIGP